MRFVAKVQMGWPESEPVAFEKELEADGAGEALSRVMQWLVDAKYRLEGRFSGPCGQWEPIRPVLKVQVSPAREEWPA